MRLIFVPQYPSRMRYQEWWLSEFPKNLEPYFDEIITIYGYNEEEISQAKPGDFSPIDKAINWECAQIKEYMEMKLYNDDIMFIADLSFPGLFPNILHHKKPSKVFMFCHGTSLNYLDYFQSTRESKSAIERGHYSIADFIFVGSQYHKEKLAWGHKVKVLPLPYPPFRGVYPANKSRSIISVARPNLQKVNLEMEKTVEKHLNLKIERPNKEDLESWETYYKFVSSGRSMLITSSEETFGYQVVDAILNSCVVIAPNKYSYPELLYSGHLYDNEKQLIKMIDNAAYSRMTSGKLKCDREMNAFYENLVYYMRG